MTHILLFIIQVLFFMLCFGSAVAIGWHRCLVAFCASRPKTDDHEAYIIMSWMVSVLQDIEDKRPWVVKVLDKMIIRLDRYAEAVYRFFRPKPPTNLD